MAYQEKRTNSYGSRLGSSIKGIGSGFLAIVAGTCLLWWNEGRAVKTSKMLNEAESSAVHVESVATINPEFEGKLIHASAQTATSDSLSDPMFAVGTVGIRLDRKVEVYQWVEEKTESKKDKIGGGEEIVTTYTYKQDWVSKPINSTEFKDPAYQGKNKMLMQLEDKTEMAKTVTFGAYRLPEAMISAIRGEKTLDINLPEDQIKQLNNAVITAMTGQTPEQYRAAKLRENTALKFANPSATVVHPDSIIEFVHQSGNMLYLGKNSATPEIGDVRVTFTYVEPGRASIIAKVQGDTFVKFTAKNGKTLSTLVMGDKSMEEMFESERSSNSMWLWIWRFVGLMLVIGGFKSIFAILPTLFKVLPFLADVVNLGVGLICSVLGFVWSLIVVAIAWLFYRPILAIILLAIAGASIFFLVKKGRDKKNNPNPEK